MATTATGAATTTAAAVTEPVVIVGGGMAGLACAWTLTTAGVPVRVLEASDDFGGRVHSTQHTGLPADDGFQVLFRAYPETRRLMDAVGFPQERIRPYDRGAICYSYGAPFTFGPDPRDLTTFPIMTIADKARLGLLAATLLRTPDSDIWNDPRDETTEAYLRRFGFSKDAIEQFFRPFFTGILLNPSLDTSSRNFRYDYKMLVSGQTFTTPGGVGEIPAAIAAGVRTRGVVLDTGAKAERLTLSEDGARATGVTVRRSDGSTEQIAARGVVVAAPALEARRLLAAVDAPVAERIPTQGLASTTVLWRLPRPLYGAKKILLNVDGIAGQRRQERGFHLAMQLTNVTHPESTGGTGGKGHLLGIASVAEACADQHYREKELPREALATLGKWFPHSGIEADAELVEVRYIPFSQFAQPPGFREKLPSNLTRFPTLMVAGEYTEASSIEGAVVSGIRAAEHLRAALARKA